MTKLKPRIVIGLAMLIAGVVVMAFFDKTYGVALVFIGTSEIVYVLLRDRSK